MILNNELATIEKLQNSNKLNNSITESEKNKTLKLFQPKLLRIKSVNSICDQNAELDKFYKTEKFKVNKKKEKFEKSRVVPHSSKAETRNKILSFYKNPFVFMDYLIETYFKEKFTEREFRTLKENLFKELNNTSNHSRDDIKSFFTKEISEFQRILKEDIRECLQKFNSNSNQNDNVKINHEKIKRESEGENEDLKFELSKDKFVKLIEETIAKIGKTKENESLKAEISQNKKEKVTENETNNPLINNLITEAKEIESEPIYHQEIFKKLFPTTTINSPDSKFHSIINTQTDIKNHLLNSDYSSLSSENILKKTLECLKGDKIEIPTRKFLEVKNLTMKDINLNQIVYTKNIILKLRQLDSFKHQNEEEVLKQIQKTSEHEKKIFKNLIENTNNSINQMENHQKISEEVLNKLKEKLNTEFNENMIKISLSKLKIHEKNLDLIKDGLIDVKQENIINIKERIQLIEENNKKVDLEIEKLFANEKVKEEKKNAEDSLISDAMINELYKKFTKKTKKKSNDILRKLNQKKVLRPSTGIVNNKYK